MLVRVSTYIRAIRARLLTTDGGAGISIHSAVPAVGWTCALAADSSKAEESSAITQNRCRNFRACLGLGCIIYLLGKVDGFRSLRSSSRRPLVESAQILFEEVTRVKQIF